MKYTSSILLIAICILAISFENAAAYVASNADLELLEASMNLEINRCELETNETKLKECDKKIMEYANMLCLQYGTLESGKCEPVEQYFIERTNSKG